MRFDITPEITEFISACVGCVPGASADICRKHAIPHAVLSRILHGTKKGVDEGTWLRLCDAFPRLRNMSRQRTTTTNPVPMLSGPMSQPTIDAFRLNLQDSILNEKRIDDKTKMLVLQIIAEVANGK